MEDNNYTIKLDQCRHLLKTCQINEGLKQAKALHNLKPNETTFELLTKFNLMLNCDEAMFTDELDILLSNFSVEKALAIHRLYLDATPVYKPKVSQIEKMNAIINNLIKSNKKSELLTILELFELIMDRDVLLVKAHLNIFYSEVDAFLCYKIVKLAIRFLHTNNIEVVSKYLNRLDSKELKECMLSITKDAEEQTVKRFINNDLFMSLLYKIIETDVDLGKCLIFSMFSKPQCKENILERVNDQIKYLIDIDASYIRALKFVKNICAVESNVAGELKNSFRINDVIQNLEATKELTKNKDSLCHAYELLVDLMITIDTHHGKSVFAENRGFFVYLLSTKNKNIYHKVILILLKFGASDDLRKADYVDYEKLFNHFIDEVNTKCTDLRITTEILCYYTNQGYFKNKVAHNQPLINIVFSYKKPNDNNAASVYVPDSSFLFMLLKIMFNCMCYLPPLTDEQSKMNELKAKTQNPNKNLTYNEYNDEFNKRNYTKKRIAAMFECDAVTKAISDLSVTKSVNIWIMLSRIYSSIAYDNIVGSKIMQCGLVKHAINLAYHMQTLLNKQEGNGKTDDFTDIYLNLLQFVAIAGIHNHPNKVFPKQYMYDIVPLLLNIVLCPENNNKAHKLIYDKATKLHQFETLMCLTNVISVTREMPEYIIKATQLLNNNSSSRMFFLNLFGLVLDDNKMVQRAAVELVCNISQSTSEFGLIAYIIQNENNVDLLHALFALSDAEDMQTQLAASGSLANIMANKHVCRTVMNTNKRKEKNLICLFRRILISNHENRRDNFVDLFHRLLIVLKYLVMCIVENNKNVMEELFDYKLDSLIDNISQSNVLPISFISKEVVSLKSNK